MAYYRLSTMMKLKRELLGYSRDDFDVDGPCGMTVYRMEEGKNKMSERSFRKLTKAMGMEESTGRGLLRTKALEVLMDIIDNSDFFLGRQYEELETNLLQLEEILDLSVPRNLQYVSYLHVRVRFQKGNISKEEYAKEMCKVLLYTCPSKEESLLAKWPYCMMEWKIFMSIMVAVKNEKNYTLQKELAKQAEQLLLSDYLANVFKVGYLTLMWFMIGDALGNMGFHEQAIRVGKENLLLCKRNNEIRFLSEVYYDIFWNYLMVKKKGKTLTDEEETFCRQCLIKAYYLNKALFPAKELYLVRLRKIILKFWAYNFNMV